MPPDCLSAFTPTEADDLDAVARRYFDLLDHKRDLAMCEQELIDVLHTLAGGKKEWTVDGRVIATTFKATSPKTDGEGLLRAVVARARDERQIDRETGECLESEGEAVARVLAEVYPITNASVRPRTTALRSRHIDLSEFSEPGGWARTVRTA